MLAEAKYHLTQNHLRTPLDFEGFRLHQIGRLHCGSGMVIGQHLHYGWFEITAVTEGCGEVFTGNIGTKVKAGDIYFSFPCDMHDIRSSREAPLKYDFFSFSTELSPFKEELDGIMERLSPENRVFSDRRINRCLEELTLNAEKGGKLTKPLTACLIKEILIYIINDLADAAPQKPRHAESRNAENAAVELCFQLMNYINTHLFSMKSLSELSGLTGYNYSYLSTLFKQITSQTLRSYYRQKRLETAKSLLKEQDMTAVRAAELLGYSSASAFGKAYKLQFGESPLGKGEK